MIQRVVSLRGKLKPPGFVNHDLASQREIHLPEGETPNRIAR
jgi:hypothetical protein